MTAVLGIDAAWSTGHPSGVALVAEAGAGWRCLGVAPSYGQFVRLAEAEPETVWREKPLGGLPPVADLLRAARSMLARAGYAPDIAVAAVDMPLSNRPIVGRRDSDNAAARALARFACSTHSPSPGRPGKVGEALRQGFAAAGFHLAMCGEPPRLPALAEVYPHAALVGLFVEKGRMALTNARRLPYKVAKSTRYWPGVPAAERVARLCGQYRDILELLRQDIAIEAFPIPGPGQCTLSGLKPCEDALDALVCCWMGMRILQGRAVCLGDGESGIWVPANTV